METPIKLETDVDLAQQWYQLTDEELIGQRVYSRPNWQYHSTWERESLHNCTLIKKRDDGLALSS